MNHCLVLKSCATVVASLLCVNTAYASKAKLRALQGAAHIVDPQTIFENPSDLHQLGNFLTLELGSSALPASPKAEGGLFQERGGAKVGFYLGHLSAEQTRFRLANGFLLEENPVEFFYGRANWAASLGYSQSDNKTSDTSQQTAILRYGLTQGAWDAWVNLELIAKADAGTSEYQGAPIFRAGGSYEMGNYFFDGKLTFGGVKNKIADVETSTDMMRIELLALDRSIKTQHAQIYFGPGIVWEEVKIGSNKITSMEIPVFAGIEHSFFEWLDIRASISQNFLFGSTKDGTQTPPDDKADTISNNTTVAAGFGFKRESLNIDASFSGSNSGELNANTLLAHLGMTYSF